MKIMTRSQFFRHSSWGRVRRLGLIWCSLLLALLIAACQQGATTTPSTPTAQPTVVTTSTMITDWVRQVAGDRLPVVGILQPGSDPHLYEPVPQDLKTIETAALIFYNGYNLEPALIRLIESAGEGVRRVPLGEKVPPLIAGKEPDPHVWGDVQRVRTMVGHIATALGDLQPQDRSTFTQNAEAYQAQLQRLDAWIRAQIATIPPTQRRLVTTHDAFQYYAQTYGLTVPGTLIGLSTEEQPSAQTAKNLAQSIREQKIPTIFTETTLNPQLIRTIAQEAGVEVSPQELYSDSIGALGSPGDSYITMMVSNTRAITLGLGGQVTEFTAAGL
jgi:manganese/iron transport system substrate-binding protein